VRISRYNARATPTSERLTYPDTSSLLTTDPNENETSTCHLHHSNRAGKIPSTSFKILTPPNLSTKGEQKKSNGKRGRIKSNCLSLEQEISSQEIITPFSVSNFFPLKQNNPTSNKAVDFCKEEDIESTSSSDINNDDPIPTDDDNLTVQRNHDTFHIRHMIKLPFIRLYKSRSNDQSNPSELKLNGGRNVVSSLFARSVFSSTNIRNQHYINRVYGLRQWTHNHWKRNSSLYMGLNAHHPSGIVSTSMPASRRSPESVQVSCMEFDSHGILLAVGDTKGYIRIYDFDEIRTMEMKCERKNLRNQQRYDEEHKLNFEIDNNVAINTDGNVGRCDEILDEGEIAMKKQAADCSNIDKKIQVKGNVSPFIIFSTGPRRISCMKWSSFNEDLLAVSFLNDKHIRIYDVSSSTPKGPIFFCLSDPLMDEQVKCDGGNSTLCYLHQQQKREQSIQNTNSLHVMVGGKNGMLQLWTVSHERIMSNHTTRIMDNTKQQKRKYIKCHWSYAPWTSIKKASWSESITDIIPLFSDKNNSMEDKGAANGFTKPELVLVSGIHGSFALIDIKNCTRKAFSPQIIPQLLKTWNLSSEKGLMSSLGYKNRIIDVRKCFTWKEVEKMNRSEKLSYKFIDATIVTTNGCVLNMNINVRDKSLRAVTGERQWDVKVSYLKVFHGSNGRNSDVVFDNEITHLSSVPKCLAGACSYGLSSSICVTESKRIPMILPDKDDEVLNLCSSIQYQSRKSSDDSIFIIDKKGLNLHHKISSLGNSTIQHIAIHPENDWMVVSVEDTTTSKSCSSLHLFEVKR